MTESNKENVDGYADGEVPTHGQTVTRSNPENVLNPDGYESADVIEKSTISQQCMTESKN